MFGLRFTSDVQNRWKNGSPHHKTTGVDSANSIQGRRAPPNKLMNACGQNMLPIAIASSGAVSTTPTQKRRVMSRNSGFSSAAAVTVRGSSAMPQIGHEPGSERTISGCIGHVYSVRVDAAGSSGSSAIPQDGQAPGLLSRTSGHIGHTYAGPAAAVGLDAARMEIGGALSP